LEINDTEKLTDKIKNFEYEHIALNRKNNIKKDHY